MEKQNFGNLAAESFRATTEDKNDIAPFDRELFDFIHTPNVSKYFEEIFLSIFIKQTVPLSGVRCLANCLYWAEPLLKS
jgi:hypothetical protein